MRIQVLSDLHVEFKYYRIKMAKDADVLLIAGDLGVAKSVKGLRALAKSTDVPIIFVTGNHDYYYGVMDEVNEDLKQIEHDTRNFHFLNDECMEIEGVEFVGSTLWSDFGLAPDLGLFAQRVKFGINDFYYINQSEGVCFSPDDCRELNRAATSFLKEAICSSSNSKKVVVTHFLPSPRSIHPKYASSPLNPYFCCDCEDLMGSKVSLWVHGHTHTSMDYEHRGTRVMANPRGYYGENKKFKGMLSIEI